MVSRHSAFYSPLICTIAGDYLRKEGLSASYAVLSRGQRSHVLIREGEVDIMQSAVSSNWKPLERGESPLPVHFAQINQRDGFFLVARHPAADFRWRDLEGKVLLADHGLQPLTMLRYAAYRNGVELLKSDTRDRGTPEEMEEAFHAGEGDYVHLQAPGPQRLGRDGSAHTVASVGAAMPPVAFSSLCCSRAFVGTEPFRAFVRAYTKAREWARSASAEEIAQQEASYFPTTDPRAVAAAISRYQDLGCWHGGIEIPPSLIRTGSQYLRMGSSNFEAACLRRGLYGSLISGARPGSKAHSDCRIRETSGGRQSRIDMLSHGGIADRISPVDQAHLVFIRDRL